MEFELTGEARSDLGRGGCRRLRRSGRIPAIVYGGGEEPQAVSLGQNELFHEMDRDGFHTNILTLRIGKTSESVVVKAVQRHPSRPQILHLDFQRIVADQAITLNVPIHFVGEEDAAGVKEGGDVQRLLTDVEITCLPRHLPDNLEIDISELALGQLLHLSDVQLPEGVSCVALDHGQDQPVVAIALPRREEIDEVVDDLLEGEEVPTEDVPVGDEDETSDDAPDDD